MSICPRNVVFVGNSLAFPDTLLAILNSTFADFQFRRVANTNALLSGDAPDGSIEAMVVDAGILGPNPAEDGLAALAAFEDRARIAVAYREESMATQLLAATEKIGRLSSISLLPLNCHLEVMISVIRLILCGERYLSCDLLLSQAAAAENAAAGPVERSAERSNLTDREWDVLSLVADGMPNKMIAHRLGLSENTVKLHVHRMLGKLGASNRTEASNWFQVNAAQVERASVA